MSEAMAAYSSEFSLFSTILACPEPQQTLSRPKGTTILFSKILRAKLFPTQVHAFQGSAMVG
jgi:hypothetical protein